MTTVGSHTRRNALTGERVLVSPQRLQRPWQGLEEHAAIEILPAYDPECYLCPGNDRAGGISNPDYEGAYVFDNDFPALSATHAEGTRSDPLFDAQPLTGHCRVICYTERHDLCLANMNTAQLRTAFGAMAVEFADLDHREDVAYVQLFENRGLMMGCSNPHPHAQVWATSSLPTEPAKELESQRSYLQEYGRPLLLDYLVAEIDARERIVLESRYTLAVVPYWAVWPYEALLIPKRPLGAPDEFEVGELDDLAQTLSSVLACYGDLFGLPAPYSLGFHPRPSDGEAHPEWQFHIHVYPPLLRSASVRKHMVGFEMLGQPQRDLTPETAAQRLRAVLERGSRD